MDILNDIILLMRVAYENDEPYSIIGMSIDITHEDGIFSVSDYDWHEKKLYTTKFLPEDLGIAAKFFLMLYNEDPIGNLDEDEEFTTYS